MTHLPLFDIPHTDPSVLVAALRRLGGQNRAVYERLLQGPATNVELERLAGRVNSRVADVRRYVQERYGWRLECHVVEADIGIYRYEIDRTQEDCT